MIGCDGIVNLNTFQTGPQVQSFPDCLLMFKKFRVVHGNHMFSQSKKLTRIIFQKTWFVVLLGKECACSVSLMSSTGLLLDCATSQALPGSRVIP